MFSEQLLDRFSHPRFAGDDPEASALGRTGNPTCGDVIEIRIRVEDGVIMNACFQTLGCAVAIAASDAICEIAQGATVSSAELVSADELVDSLGGVPEGRHVCAEAPLEALRAALERLRSN